MYLLDAYHCLHLLAGDSQIKRRLAELDKAPVMTSEIVYDELLWMARRSLHPAQNCRAVQALGKMLPVYGIYSKTIQEYRLLKKALMLHVTSRFWGVLPSIPIAEHNLWIAASALHLKATLVSRDSDFDHIQKAEPQLRVERWRVEV